MNLILIKHLTLKGFKKAFIFFNFIYPTTIYAAKKTRAILSRQRT